MTGIAIASIALALAAFWVWYSGWRGPLTPGEVEAYLSRLKEVGAPEEAFGKMRTFLADDTGRPFVMVNLMHMREGTEAEASFSGYHRTLMRLLLGRASHVTGIGTVAGTALELEGVNGAESWSSVFLIRYRSRRDLIAAVTDPRIIGEHAGKGDFMDRKIAIPIERVMTTGDPRVLSTLVATIAVLVVWVAS